MNQYSFQGFNYLPPVVKNLLIINILFFLATFAVGSAFHIDLYQMLGLHFFTADAFRPWQLITYMFMHGDISHLFFNMFALWMFGYLLENVWGSKRFLIYYLITGIGAALIHYGVLYIEMKPMLDSIDVLLTNPSNDKFVEFFNSGKVAIVSEEVQSLYIQFVKDFNYYNTTDPQKALSVAIEFMSEYRVGYLNAPLVVGASGSVFGILLAFGMLFPNTLIYVFFAIPIKAKYFVMGYGALELFFGMANRAGDNVAHFAHLGGMIFGFLLIMLWKKKSGSYFH